MNPLLAIRAASLGRDLVESAAAGFSQKSAAPAENQPAFAEMLARVAASPKVQAARFLQAQGIQSRPDLEKRLTTTLPAVIQSPAVQRAISGSGGDFTLTLLGDGTVRVRTGDGAEQICRLSDEAAKAAGTARALFDAVRTAAPELAALPAADADRDAPALQVRRGGGVTLAS